MNRRSLVTDSLGCLHGRAGLLLLPLLVFSCQSKDKGSSSVPGSLSPGVESDFAFVISPSRDMDILFVVDNSPSMDLKQEALAKAFAKLLQGLQSAQLGLPDLHIGVVSSDMGAGATEAGGSCSVLLGNKGILWGNDPNADPSKDNNQFATVKNLKNATGADGCGMNSGARWIEDLMNADGLTRTKNYQGNLTDVFSCLAKGVGVTGCGYEHQLQALRVALNPMDNINPQNRNFLRPRAYLAIVLVTDEDDCSADPNSETNDRMFFPRTLGEASSLRCAARGHVCNGQDIPNYDPATGYAGPDPFVARFADCEAKDDASLPRNYKKLPLIRIRDMIDSVKQIKEWPEDQILASGIIGWPEGGPAEAEYRIDKDSPSLPVEQQTLWNHMPICTVPDAKSADGNIYKAYGGLRLKKFLDAFEKPGEANVFSICNPDFADAMTSIGKTLGNAIALRINNCIRFGLVDADPNLLGIQPECSAFLRRACDTPGTGSCASSGYISTSIALCRGGDGNPLDPDNPLVEQVVEAARPCWHLRRDLDSGCGASSAGMQAIVLMPTGQAPPRGSLLSMSCMTCPDGQPSCQL